MNKSSKCVRDMMVSLDEYAVVPEDATLLDALFALESAQANLSEGSHRHRAVLVRDNDGRIIGKVGHFAFLKALRAIHERLDQNPRLRRAGLDEDTLKHSEDIFRLFNEDDISLCGRARTLLVRDAMHPINHRIQENKRLLDALYAFDSNQTLSLLVTDKGHAVGILRLVDLFDEIAEIMKRCVNDTGDETNA